ncbi:hypothetical protein ACVBEQ_11320 [Nakamurella sp. GG22]
MGVPRITGSPNLETDFPPHRAQVNLNNNGHSRNRRPSFLVYVGKVAIRRYFVFLITSALLVGLSIVAESPIAAGAVVPTSVDDKVTSGTNYFSYTGSSWTNCGGCNATAYQNSFHYGYTTGDKVVFTFYGSQARIHGYKERPGGIAAFSIDGRVAADVDYYANTQALTSVFATPVLPVGRHTVTITVTGRKTAGSSTTINVDRAEVYTTSPTVTSNSSATNTASPTITTPPTTTSATPSIVVPTAVDDKVTSGTNSFSYTGLSWTNCGGCNATAYQNSFHYGYTTGDKAVFTFYGSQARIHGYKELAGGIAAVSVDGRATTDIDYYAGTQTPATIFTSPVLPVGRHSISITVTGRKSAGLSPTINIDRAEVYTAPVAATTGNPTTTPPPITTTPSTPQGTWLSGAGGQGDLIANGSFGQWRGDPLDIVTTWSENTADNARNMWQFTASNGELRTWNGDVDLAIGAIWAGNSWAQAASGGMDSTWSAVLNTGKRVMTGNRADNTMYIRFAHEMNGNWYSHSVAAGDVANFRLAWIRFYNLKQAIFPQAKLVFGTNGDTSGQSYDWRTLWPGDKYVDVYSTDWYSNHWKRSGNSTGIKADGYGAPVGLESHRKFAQDHGVPMGISEWGINWNETGDAPAYIQQMHDFFVAHAGSGPGNIRYENVFNNIQGNHQFDLFPVSGSKSPKSAEKYSQLW